MCGQSGLEQTVNETKPFGLKSWSFIEGRWRLPRKKNPKRHTCSVQFCQRDPAPRGPLCYTCKSREWRANNPIKYAFWNLKNRARQRGHVFTITVQDLVDVVTGSEYIERHGRFAACLSIDRVQSHLGYIPGNLQILTVSENIRKRYVELPA